MLGLCYRYAPRFAALRAGPETAMVGLKKRLLPIQTTPECHVFTNKEPLLFSAFPIGKHVVFHATIHPATSAFLTSATKEQNRHPTIFFGISPRDAVA